MIELSSLKFIVTLARCNGESHVDTAKDIVRVGLSIKKSLSFIVTLKFKNIHQLIF
jgi:hypothetical protein